MGGFRPSPNFIPSNTQMGTLTSSNHQFTGSVDITGSLLINGVAITANGGGGGGTPGGSNTQVQFNNGGAFGASAAFTFDGTSVKNTGATLLATSTGTVGVGTTAPIAKLHISSSGEVPLLRIDATEQDTNQPILFVSGTGLVAIGTDSPRSDSGDTNRLHILGESGADQGQDPVVNTVLMLENNSHANIQFMTPNSSGGAITWGNAGDQRRATHYWEGSSNRWQWEGRATGVGYGDCRVMTVAANGDSINIGSSSANHMLTSKASLHISSSTESIDTGGGVLLRADHANQPLGEPILFVTGSKRIGVGTSAPAYTLELSGAEVQAGLGLALAGYNGSRANAANFAHNVHMSDTAYALQQRHTGETILNAPSGQNVSVRINGSNALVVAGALGANVGINTGSPAARLHVSGTSGEKDVLRVDGDGQKEHSLYVQGTTGHVGIGTGTPLSRLTVVSTGSQARFSYDADSFATITVADDSHTTIASGESGDITIDSAGDIHLQCEGGQVNFQRPGSTERLIFDIAGGPAYITHKVDYPMIFRVGTAQAEVFRIDQAEDSLLMNTDSEVQFRDSETGIHSPSANILEVNSKASGSTQFIVSGAFGNTDFETRSVNFSILSPSGTSLIDTTSLANNTTYTYSIENGAFVGQQKKIFGKVTYVYGQTTNSNALIVTGSNIEGSNFGSGAQCFLSNSVGYGGMSLVWGGSKWLCVGTNNFQLQ